MPTGRGSLAQPYRRSSLAAMRAISDIAPILRPIPAFARAGHGTREGGTHGYVQYMEITLEVVLIVVGLLNVALVGYFFFWAAGKDGEYDQATQRRLGIRRRTRLGPD